MTTTYRPLPGGHPDTRQRVSSSIVLLIIGLVLLVGGVVAAIQTMWGLTAVTLAVAVASVGAGIVIDSLARRLE